MNQMEHKILRIIAATLLFAIILVAAAPFCMAVVWSPDAQITTDPIAWDLMPSAIQARDGTMWVVWASDRIGFQYDLYYKTSSDGGVSWSAAYRLTGHGGLDEFPSIIQAWNETMWVVWASTRTGNKEIFYKTSSDGGVSWSPAFQLTNNGVKDTNPSITQNVDRKIWVVWHREEAGNYDLFCKSSSDHGQSWSSETRITTDPNVDWNPSIAHTANGTLWVVWESYRAESNYELFYKTSNDGISWSDATRLTTDSAKVDEHPSVVQDVSGSIWVVWAKGLEIYYKNSPNFGLDWSLDTLITKSSGDDENPSVTNVRSRKMWVVWESTRTDYDIYQTISDEIPSVHDVALINIKAWGYPGFEATWVPRGAPIDINVTVENQGTFQETFNVTVYVDRNVGDLRVYNETQTGITLSSDTNTTLTFTWDTVDAAYGTYYISANVTEVAGEYDTFDNVIFNGAKIGGICVPLQLHPTDIVAILAPVALATLFVAALGAIGIFVFKLLMSIRLRWPWYSPKKEFVKGHARTAQFYVHSTRLAFAICQMLPPRMSF